MSRSNQLFLALTALVFSSLAHSANIPVSLKIVKEDCSKDLFGVKEKEEIEITAINQSNFKDVTYKFWYSNDGFELSPDEFKKYVKQNEKVSSKNSSKIKIPMLRADLPFTYMTIGVVVQDDKGNAGMATQRVRVTRQLVFERNQEHPVACRQVYKPETLRSLVFNQNDTDLMLSVQEAEQKIVERQEQKSKGWSFSPSFFFGGFGFNLFSFSSQHLKALTTQVQHTIYVQIDATLNPGDAGFLYLQRSRLKEAFKVYSIDQCGGSTFAGDALIDNWKNAYNLIKVDPLDPNPYNSQAYGESVSNSCEEIDTYPKFDFDHTTNTYFFNQ